jgi:hypothetical protein
VAIATDLTIITATAEAAEHEVVSTQTEIAACLQRSRTADVRRTAAARRKAAAATMASSSRKLAGNGGGDGDEVASIGGAGCVHGHPDQIEAELVTLHAHVRANDERLKRLHDESEEYDAQATVLQNELVAARQGHQARSSASSSASHGLRSPSLAVELGRNVPMSPDDSLADFAENCNGSEAAEEDPVDPLLGDAGRMQLQATIAELGKEVGLDSTTTRYSTADIERQTVRLDALRADAVVAEADLDDMRRQVRDALKASSRSKRGLPAHTRECGGGGYTSGALRSRRSTSASALAWSPARTGSASSDRGRWPPLESPTLTQRRVSSSGGDVGFGALSPSLTSPTFVTPATAPIAPWLAALGEGYDGLYGQAFSEFGADSVRDLSELDDGDVEEIIATLERPPYSAKRFHLKKIVRMLTAVRQGHPFGIGDDAAGAVVVRETGVVAGTGRGDVYGSRASADGAAVGGERSSTIGDRSRIAVARQVSGANIRRRATTLAAARQHLEKSTVVDVNDHDLRRGQRDRHPPQPDPTRRQRALAAAAALRPTRPPAQS